MGIVIETKFYQKKGDLTRNGWRRNRWELWPSKKLWPVAVVTRKARSITIVFLITVVAVNLRKWHGPIMEIST